MAANAVPRMVLPVNSVAMAQVSAANANRDGTGTIVDLITAGAEGCLIELIRAVATGSTTAGVIRLFWWTGAAWRLYEEILVTAITPSASVKVWFGEYVPSKPFVLPAGVKLGVSTHNAEVFNCFATGGNY